eukprot:gene24525-31939_t
MSTIGPKYRPEPLRGVELDYFTKKYIAHYNNNTIGRYCDELSAVKARDSEILLSLTIDLLDNRIDELSDQLNEEYTLNLINSQLDEKKRSYVVTDRLGDSFSLLVSDNYSPIRPPNRQKCQDISTAYILPSTAQPADNNKRWQDRISHSYAIPHSFTFEVTFHNTGSLGMSLQYQLVSYSSGGGPQRIGCCVVMEAIQGINTYIHQGDFLLRVNDTTLISNGIESLSLDKMTQSIKEATSPRTIRFLRVAGSANNMLPSPVELHLFRVNSHVSAKFNVLASSANTPMTPTLTYLDPQSSPIVKKLMQGAKAMWDSSNPSTHLAISKQSDLLHGVYKDRGKWVAVVGSNNKLVSLGRFDREDEAKNSYKRAMQEISKLNHCSSKRIRKQM